MHVLFHWVAVGPLSPVSLGLLRLGFWLAALLAALAAPSASAQLLPNTTAVRGASQSSHYFGDSVAISGDTMAAGTSSNKTVYVFRRGAGGWELESQFLADFPNTIFGDVRLDGDVMTVGNAVYVRSGTAWTKQATLPVGNSRAIAIKGERIVVGDAQDGYDGTYPSADGAVYVYARVGDTWVEEAKLVPDLPRNEAMGYTVAFDGDTIVAMPDPFGPNPASYVFERSGNTWQQRARLTLPTGAVAGWACGVDGDWLALADPRANFVYLYQRTGGAWNYVQSVGASDANRDYFGAELCLSNGFLAVLSERVTTWPTTQRELAGYLFARTSSGWVQAQRLDRAGGVIFGSIAMTKRAVVLGDGSDSSVASYAGGATIFDVPAPPAPGSGWRSVDVGAVGLAGSSSGGEPTGSVTGSGADIWGTSDAFHYRTETMTGDGAIVARVTGLTNTDGFAKAGIMLREDISPSSREVMMLATPSNNISFQYRSELASETQFTLAAYGAPQAWLMLTRTGSQFSGYRSNDGSNWTLVGTTTLALEPTIHVGLAVTSHNNSALATGAFDNVDLVSLGAPPPPPPPPPPGGDWTSRDIGFVAFPGSTTISGANATLEGAGDDIWGANDAFHFAYQTLSGDGSVVVRVGSVENTHGWAKGGIMLRDGTDANAKNVMILARPDNTVSFQYRAATGGSTVMNFGSWNLATVWLKLTRTGDLFEGFESTDGTNWRRVGSATLAMPASLLAGLAVTSHTNAQLATATFADFSIAGGSAPPPPPPPPSGDWQSVKIGDGLEGSFSESGGVFTVAGSGSDVWGTSDSFRFVYRAMEGDGEVVARVAALTTTGGTSPIAKYGVMVRDSLAANSSYGFVFVTPSDLVAFENRRNAGGNASRVGTFYDRFIPQWLKIVRHGTSLTYFCSEDGVTWLDLATQTIEFGSSVYVGLAVCAHDATRVETAQFDHVSVTGSTGGGGPPPAAAWTSARIGSASSGSATIGAEAITVNSASADIWGTADAFEFVYRPWTGDGEIIARVDSLTNTHSWAKAGVMFRESLAAGSAHAFALLTPAVGVSFQYRGSTGGATEMPAHHWGPAAPHWVRLVRTGNMFTAYVSPNGAAWTLLGTQMIAMGSDIYVGFAVTSHDSGASVAATFSSFSLE